MYSISIDGRGATHLERKVPSVHPVTGGRDDEDIEVAAAEDEGVEGLGDEGDT